MKSPLFKSAILTVIFVCAFELIAFKLYLQYTLIWGDMPMHFLGGFLVSIVALMILTRNTSNFSYGQLLFWGLLSAFVIGVLWECYELYYGITDWYSPGYWGDNGMDVVMDIFGGLSAVLYSYFKILNLKS